MNTGSMFGFIDMVVLGCGLYGIYSWYLLLYKKEIKKMFLLGGDYQPEGCSDIDGFAKAMGTKLLIVSIAMILFSGLSMYNDNVASVGVFYWIALVLFLVLLTWYSAMLRKYNKQYFAESRLKNIKDKALNKK